VPKHQKAIALLCTGAVVGFLSTGLALSSGENTRQSADRAKLARQLMKERQKHERLERQFERRLDNLRVRVVLTAPTAHLARIAACESGGRANAVSPDGTYRGKYQFDFSTWRGVGGTGDPAAAAEPEQDYRAWLLYLRRGAQPWPVCGRR
jgi:hypothetical protein